MGHKKTDPAIISLLMQQCYDHGFRPFHVKKDSMGYIYNRLELPPRFRAGILRFSALELLTRPEFGQQSKEKRCSPQLRVLLPLQR